MMTVSSLPHFIRGFFLGLFLLLFAPGSDAQVQLIREAGPGGMPCVKMEAGRAVFRFDVLSGGTPRLSVKENGGETLLTSSTRSKAFGVRYAPGGQVVTQAGAGGAYPIGLIGDAPSLNAFGGRIRETRFEPPATSGAAATYEITGSLPVEWLSDRAEDDAFPTTMDWSLPYQNDGDFPEDSGDAPIFWGKSTAGILCPANETLPLTHAWYRRLYRTSGFVHLGAQIDFSAASDDAWAGLVLRRTLSSRDPIRSAGYALLLSRQGAVTLLRYARQNASPVTVWQGNVPLAWTNAPGGIWLEARTFPETAGKIQVLANGVVLGAYVDPRPILGKHVGVLASTQSGTVVGIRQRMVVDLGLEMTARYTGTPEGVISDITVRNVLKKRLQPTFLPAGLPGGRLNSEADGLNTLAAYDAGGSPLREFLDPDNERQTVAGPNPTTTGVLLTPLLRTPQSRTTLFAGNSDSGIGLYATPLSVETNGRRATSAFGLLAVEGDEGELLLGVSPIRYRAKPRGVSLFTYRAVTHWRLAPLPVEVILHAPAIEAARGQKATLSVSLTTKQGAPLEGMTLQLYRQDVLLDTQETEATGVATFDVETGDLAIGVHPLRIAHAGSDQTLPASVETTLTVTKAVPVLSVSLDPAEPSPVGTELAVACELQDNEQAVPEQTLSVSLNGVFLQNVQTDAAGTASLTLVTKSLGLGNHVLRVAFAGNDQLQSAFVETTFTLTKATTTLGASLDPEDALPVASTVSLIGELLANEEALQGQILTFAIDGVRIGSAQTNAEGRATLSYLVALAPGPHSLKVTYEPAATDPYTAAESTVAFEVVRNQTTLELEDASGALGEEIELVASGNREEGTMPPGKSIQFFLDNTLLGTAVTGNDGSAKLTLRLEEHHGVGSHRLRAVFTTDAEDEGATAEAALQVEQAGTVLEADLPEVAAFGATVPFTFRLSRSTDGTSVAGRTVRILVNGGQIGTAVTDGEGRARINYLITTINPTEREVGAFFDGDAAYESSESDTKTLHVVKSDVRVEGRNAGGKRGATVPLHVFLHRASDGAALEDQEIVFFIDNRRVGTDRTNPSGYAAISYRIPASMAFGEHTIRYEFEGNSRHNAGVDRQTLTVRQ